MMPSLAGKGVCTNVMAPTPHLEVYRTAVVVIHLRKHFLLGLGGQMQAQAHRETFYCGVVYGAVSVGIEFGEDLFR